MRNLRPSLSRTDGTAARTVRAFRRHVRPSDRPVERRHRRHRESTARTQTLRSAALARTLGIRRSSRSERVEAAARCRARHGLVRRRAMVLSSSRPYEETIRFDRASVARGGKTLRRYGLDRGPVPLHAKARRLFRCGVEALGQSVVVSRLRRSPPSKPSRDPGLRELAPHDEARIHPPDEQQGNRRERRWSISIEGLAPSR